MPYADVRRLTFSRAINRPILSADRKSANNHVRRAKFSRKNMEESVNTMTTKTLQFQLFC